MLGLHAYPLNLVCSSSFGSMVVYIKESAVNFTRFFKVSEIKLEEKRFFFILLQISACDRVVFSVEFATYLYEF